MSVIKKVWKIGRRERREKEPEVTVFTFYKTIPVCSGSSRQVKRSQIKERKQVWPIKDNNTWLQKIKPMTQKVRIVKRNQQEIQKIRNESEGYKGKQSSRIQ